MKTDRLPQPGISMAPLANPCAVTVVKNRRRKTRPARLHPAQVPAVDEGIAHLHATQAQRLVLVQEDRVVCVVERHRHDSALSVARLLCRLLLSDAWVYVCPAAEADLLPADQRLDQVPGTWREIYRATPWAEPAVEEAGSLPVVGIR